MYRRRYAVAATVALATISISPVAAHADASPTTYYVSYDGGDCSDTGPGTQADPFCSIQQGVDAATTPGDVVDVADWIHGYGPFTVSNKGTADAPITIEGSYFFAADSATAQITFNGASYVNVEGASNEHNAGELAYVSGSDHVTLNEDGDEALSASQAGVPAVEITGNSSDVTVSRDTFYEVGRPGPAVQIDAGSTGDIVSTNAITGGTPSIQVTGAPDTVITSNTVVSAGGTGCDTALSLTGGSTGAQVENNVFEDSLTTASQTCTASATPSGLLSVDAASTQGATVDYNILYPNPSLPTGTSGTRNVSAYAWGGSFYSTETAFHTATGQGTHDGVVDPQLSTDDGGFAPKPGSLLIDSANSAAAGELSTDVMGNARADDPLFPDSGTGPYTYYDRGAVELQAPATTATIVQAVGLLGVWVSSQAWSTTGYTVDFGDGTGAQNAPYGKAQHTYARGGTYTITVSGTANGTPFSTQSSFTTTSLAGSLYQTDRLAYGAWDIHGWQHPAVAPPTFAQAAITSGTSGSNGVLGYVGVTAGGVVEYETYNYDLNVWSNSKEWTALSQPGVTVTDTGIAGMSSGSFQFIEVTSTGVLKHNVLSANGTWQASGWGTPAGSTGIAKASITAMPNGDSQLLAVTTSGVLEHNIRFANGSWQGWRALSQPGVKITDASIAGMPNGSSQLIEVTSTGVLKHNVRNANGTWQASGWGTPAGSTGITQASITAMPNGDSQFVAVTAKGTLEFNIRYANGNWLHGGWTTPVANSNAASVTDASIAPVQNVGSYTTPGSSELIELSGN